MKTQPPETTSRPHSAIDTVVAWLLPAFSMLIAGIALVRIAVKGVGDAENDKTTLMYFAAAAIVLLLRDIKSLKMGDNEVVFKEAQEAKTLAKESLKKAKESEKEITEVKKIAATTTAASLAAGRLGIGGRQNTTLSSPLLSYKPEEEEPPSATEAADGDDTHHAEILPPAPAMPQTPVTRKTASGQREPKEKQAAAPPPPEDDPQKGQWGGKSIANKRSISATVSPLPLGNEYFLVRITVQSVDANDPLEGKVRFHLHPTFADSTPLVPVRDGKAELELVAWGAFTVGAEADGGATALELDLADIGPMAFRNR